MRRKSYETETGVIGLGQDGMLGFEDELGEEDLVFAFVNLTCISLIY